MIEAVAAVGAAPQPARYEVDADFSTRPGGSAAMVQAGDFARAAAVPQELQAAPPVADTGLAERLSHQADAIMAHLRAAGTPGADSAGIAPAGSSAAVEPGNASAAAAGTLDRDKANEAVREMERAYMFAIETTLASRGSTETTKIFNTLLKGQ